jgi:hypothetical protein
MKILRISSQAPTGGRGLQTAKMHDKNVGLEKADK